MKKIIIAITMAILAGFLGLNAPAARGEKQVVLFDQGHGQMFLIEKKGDLDLFNFAQVFHDQGWEVQFSRQPLTRDKLAPVDALVISGPFSPFSASEVSVIENFVRNGGRLCVMLHIGQPLEPLLEALEVSVTHGVVNEKENLIDGETLNFHVTRLERHAIHAELKRYAYYGSWGLEIKGVRIKPLARTSPRAWTDRNRNRTQDPDEPAQSVVTAVVGWLGGGYFFIFGDDAIFQNQFLKEENLALARNLARWLTTPGGRP